MYYLHEFKKGDQQYEYLHSARGVEQTCYYHPEEMSPAVEHPIRYSEPWVSHVEGYDGYEKLRYNKSRWDELWEMPLTIEITKAGRLSVTVKNANLNIQVNKNNTGWGTRLAKGTNSSAVTVGDIFQFRGRGLSTPVYYENPETGDFILDALTLNTGTTSSFCFMNTTTCEYKVRGNILSLLVGDTAKDWGPAEWNLNDRRLFEVGNYAFAGLFANNTKLTDASELIIPEHSCAADYLGVSSIRAYQYYHMFYGCTGLTAAPELPSVIAYPYCYQQMFFNCRSLTTAPTLPATALTEYCYEGMFNGCLSLNYIKCLATDISATNCTTNWVKSISANGTFIKNPAMSSWTRGVNGIPQLSGNKNGWAILDA